MSLYANRNTRPSPQKAGSHQPGQQLPAQGNIAGVKPTAAVHDPKQRKKLKSRIRNKPSSSSEQTSFFHFLGMSLSMLLKTILVIFLIAVFALIGVGGGMLSGYISTAQEIDLSNIQNNLNSAETRILDKDGNLVTTLKGGGTIAEFVPYSSLEASYLPGAFISIEDERFLNHPGIDMKRILSAVISAVLNGGNPTHGGSTITQQTVKMITGHNVVSAQRKIQEWYSAINLERTMSKEAILELYLNLVPMSNNYQGVGAAAKAYFNKDISELTLAESALLAGIPNRPATYNPMTEFGRRNCLRRMRLVLSSMLNNQVISVDEYDGALNEEIIFDFSAQNSREDTVYNWFVETVLEEVKKDLVNHKGYTPELAAMAVYNYGLTIETTLDSEAQAKLEKVFRDEALFVNDPAQLPNTPEHPQAAITVMDNRPGEEGLVRAVVGGFGKKQGNLIFNMATDAKRQPGSSIKPLVVYTPALEVGAISQASFLVDEPKYLNPNDPNTPYPLNNSRTYEGPVTLSRALLMSLNTIAADVYANILSPEVGLAYLKECGIDRTDEPYVATALGGFEEGMSTWEMTEAYSVLANHGIYHQPTSYLRVLNQDGTILLDHTDRLNYQVYKPATTYIMTTMLKNVAEASWNGAKPDNTLAAGKTGTTDNFRDVWFCGYTPYYTAAVWYGYANANGRNISIPLIDGYNACHIWRASMEELHADLPAADFARPDGVINMTICADSQQIANEFCEETRNVLLIEGSPANPDKVCEMHDAKSRERAERKKRLEEQREREQEARPTSPPPIDYQGNSQGFNPNQP